MTDVAPQHGAVDVRWAVEGAGPWILDIVAHGDDVLRLRTPRRVELLDDPVEDRVDPVAVFVDFLRAGGVRRGSVAAAVIEPVITPERLEAHWTLRLPAVPVDTLRILHAVFESNDYRSVTITQPDLVRPRADIAALSFPAIPLDVPFVVDHQRPSRSRRPRSVRLEFVDAVHDDHHDAIVDAIDAWIELVMLGGYWDGGTASVYSFGASLDAANAIGVTFEDSGGCDERMFAGLLCIAEAVHLSRQPLQRVEIGVL